MRRSIITGTVTSVAVLLAASVTGTTWTSSASPTSSAREGATTTYVVLAQSGASADAVASRLRSAGATVTEVNSDLGNFAVQPEKLTIPAGKSAEPYPMNSQLGLVGDNFPVKVSLRIGDKTESQIITVQSLFNPDGTRK